MGASIAAGALRVQEQLVMHVPPKHDVVQCV